MNDTELLSMEELIALGEQYYALIVNWLNTNLFTIESLTQLGIIFILFLISCGVTRVFDPFVHKILEGRTSYEKAEKFLKAMYLPVMWWALVFGAWMIAASISTPIIMFRMASTLISVWIAIRLVTLMIESETISRIIRIVVWSMAILNIFGLLGPFTTFLSVTTFTFGATTISVLAIITGVTSMVVLIWAALFVSSIIETKLRESPTVTPSARVLLSKLSRIVLVVLAFLFAISSMG